MGWQLKCSLLLHARNLPVIPAGFLVNKPGVTASQAILLRQQTLFSYISLLLIWMKTPILTSV
jgi:hypothetical protein